MSRPSQTSGSRGDPLKAAGNFESSDYMCTGAVVFMVVGDMMFRKLSSCGKVPCLVRSRGQPNSRTGAVELFAVHVGPILAPVDKLGPGLIRRVIIAVQIRTPLVAVPGISSPTVSHSPCWILTGVLCLSRSGRREYPSPPQMWGFQLTRGRKDLARGRNIP
jgi:hypothetical protein